MKTIILVVGLPGAGKTEVARIIGSYGIPVFRMGNRIREEVEKRGLELTVKNQEETARKMREEFGMDIAARRTLERAKKNQDKLICFEGARDMHEIKYLESHAKLVLVAVKADIETAAKRGSDRKGDPTPEGTLEEYMWRIQKEIDRGQLDVVDYKAEKRFEIDNCGTLEELKEKVARVVEEVKGL